MNDNRPPTPAAVRRQLRQEAGFGCCFCGHPFIEYHHLVAWAEDQHFRPEDMMAVCGNHHHLCTVGAITGGEQRAHKARPKNIVDKALQGQLWVTSRKLVVEFGGGKAINTPNLLTLAGEVAVRATLSPEDGRVLISSHIHGPDGALVATLTDNEWSLSPADVWDFEVFPRHATIRSGPGDIAFAVDTRSDRVRLNGKWFHRGSVVEFSPKECRVGNAAVIQGFTVESCGGMIAMD